MGKVFGFIMIIVMLILFQSHRYDPDVPLDQQAATANKPPKRKLTDAEVNATWNATWNAVSTGFKRGFIEGASK